MEEGRKLIIDIEANGLLDDVTVIYCLSVWENGVTTSYTTYTQISSFFTQLKEEDTIIGHNIITYDMVVIKKILGVTTKARLVDTLALSWYLYPKRATHNLKDWGASLGVAKVVIEDWITGTIQEYVKRCETDVLITSLLYQRQCEYLSRIYSGEGYNRIEGYLSFKMDCLRVQEENGWRLDIALCQRNLQLMEQEKQVKTEALILAMPKRLTYKKVSVPSKMYKKDNTLTVAGNEWIELLTSKHLPPDYDGIVEVLVKEEPGNPASSSQLKSWLFSLGWIPTIYKTVEEEGTFRKIPQINAGEGNICRHIEELAEQHPALENLKGLSILSHRIAILKGFLRDQKNGRLVARADGFTNTLRLQHRELVNLPSVHKPYGKEIRGCLIANEGYILCGSDMSSLEDSTKQHYMYFFDPEYVKEMRVPGFDPHLDIALLAGMLTQEQVDNHKAGIENYSKIRKDAKQVNFAAVYGAGPPKISSSSGMSLEKATLLHQIYWKRNWAVKKVSDSLRYKEIDGQLWLRNPVSGFWYSLRYLKDKFSTLNQGTGVYCFDTWIRCCRKRGITLLGQFHDEIIIQIKEGEEENTKRLLLESIAEANRELGLNIELGISVDFGHAYSDIH